MSLEEIGKAIGRIPSGLFVLTTHYEGQDNATLISWVNQCSFEPPTISVVLSRERSSCPLIEGSGAFVLNVLGEGNHELIKQFSKPSEEKSVFEGLNIQRSKKGLVVLNDAVSYLDCELINKIAVQDHLIYVGKVFGGGLLRGEEPYVHIRKTGLSY